MLLEKEKSRFFSRDHSESVWEQLIPQNSQSIHPKFDFPPQQPSRFNSWWEHGKRSGIIGNPPVGSGLGLGFADSPELIKGIQEKRKPRIWARYTPAIPLKIPALLLLLQLQLFSRRLPRKGSFSGNIFRPGTCPWRRKVGFAS